MFHEKLFALLLAAVMALSLVACSGNDTKTDEPSGDQAAEITSALSLLETVWNDYSDDEKFSVVGGGPDAEQMVDGAPGVFDLSDRSLAEYHLVLPETAEVDEAASLIHMLNANTFTAAAYHATGDAQALATELRDAVQANRWMCGFPDKVVVAVRGEYVAVAFGAEDLVDAFAGRLSGIFGMALAYDEAVQA